MLLEQSKYKGTGTTTSFSNLGFVGLCIFTHSNESTDQMQQLITGLLFVV
jgi:hypothetical protein